MFYIIKKLMFCCIFKTKRIVVLRNLVLFALMISIYFYSFWNRFRILSDNFIMYYFDLNLKGIKKVIKKAVSASFFSLLIITPFDKSEVYFCETLFQKIKDLQIFNISIYNLVSYDLFAKSNPF